MLLWRSGTWESLTDVWESQLRGRAFMNLGERVSARRERAKRDERKAETYMSYSTLFLETFSIVSLNLTPSAARYYATNRIKRPPTAVGVM